MRDHAILVRERGPDRLPDLQAVPYGLSWGALVFQVIWALWRGVWLTALAFLVAGMAMSLLAGAVGLDPASTLVVNLATVVVLALVANDLRRFELTRRGYRLVDIVAARSPARAEEMAVPAVLERLRRDRDAATEISSVEGLQGPADRSM